MRSSELEFDFKRECLFCTENVSDNVKLAVDRRKSTSIVRTLEFRDTVVIRATEREDQWGDSVLARVCNTIDLVAVEAKYHKECRIKFFLKTNEQHEAEYSRGRPESEYKSKAFNRLCEYLMKMMIVNILFLNLLNIWKLTLEERKDTR